MTRDLRTILSALKAKNIVDDGHEFKTKDWNDLENDLRTTRVFDFND